MAARIRTAWREKKISALGQDFPRLQSGSWRNCAHSPPAAGRNGWREGLAHHLTKSRVINSFVPSPDPKANPHPSDSRWSFDESHLQMRKSRTGGQDCDSCSGFPGARPVPVHLPSSATSSLMEVLLARQWEEWKLFQLQHQSTNIQWATSEHPVCARSFAQVLQI